jgi:hypothetical protein
MEAAAEAFQEMAMEFRFRRLQGVIVPQAVFPCGDQARPPQVSKMTRGGRLRNLENLHQVPDAQLSIQEEVENAQPGGIGESPKHQIDLRLCHSRSLTHGIVTGIPVPGKFHASIVRENSFRTVLVALTYSLIRIY